MRLNDGDCTADDVWRSWKVAAFQKGGELNHYPFVTLFWGSRGHSIAGRGGKNWKWVWASDSRFDGWSFLVIACPDVGAL